MMYVFGAGGIYLSIREDGFFSVLTILIIFAFECLVYEYLM